MTHESVSFTKIKTNIFETGQQEKWLQIIKPWSLSLTKEQHQIYSRPLLKRSCRILITLISESIRGESVQVGTNEKGGFQDDVWPYYLF